VVADGACEYRFDAHHRWRDVWVAVAAAAAAAAAAVIGSRCRSSGALVSARVSVNFVDDIIDIIDVVILVILHLDVEVSLDGDHELDDVEGVEAQRRERNRVVHARLGRKRKARRAATTSGNLEHRRVVQLRTEQSENLGVWKRSKGNRKWR